MSQIKANIGVSPQDVYNIATSTQGTDLGAYATTGDGRGFRYVKAGATALVPGNLVQCAVENTSIENVQMVAAAVGDKVITVATSVGTVTANSLVGGFLATTTAAGVGYQYKIAGHAFVSTSLTLTLEDPIVVALTTSSRADIIPSPFNGVIVNPTTPTGVPIGAAVCAIPASYFGWVQSHGPANVNASSALTVGVNVSSSAATAGNVAATTTLTVPANPIVGIAITGVAANEAGLVFLELD